MNNQTFNQLLLSIKEAGLIKQGKKKPSRVFEWSDVDIKAIREQFSISQLAFATLIGVSTRTLQNWEQGRRHPMGPARALLKIAAKHPKLVMKALHG